MRLKAILIVQPAMFLVFVSAVFGAMTLAVVAREIMASPDSNDRHGELTPVIVAKVQERDFADIITVVATSLANESVTVRSKVSDVIRRISFDSGSFVEGGQVIAELANTEELAELDEARSTMIEALREHDRTVGLVKDGLVATQRLDAAVSNFERAKARLNAIEARLNDRLIRAPFDGVVGLRNISEGEMIKTDTAIATLNDISVIKLDFEVPERFLSSIRADQVVQSTTTAYPGEIFAGVVTQVNNHVDRTSRTVTVRAEVPNSDNRLIPGMLLRAKVQRDERTNSSIPEAAAMRVDERAYVFVVDGNGESAHVSRREVKLGVRDQGFIEVVSGLDAGEVVVADGTHRIRDGAKVRITGERPPRETMGETER